ncbi:MAG: PAS domain S-box protein [Bacteroidota bacterium]
MTNLAPPQYSDSPAKKDIAGSGAGRLALLVVAYFSSGWLGLQLPSIESHITLVWLPTGIAVAALLRWGSGVWPAVYVGAFLVNLAIGSGALLAAGIAIGNTLGPWLAARWLKRAGFDPAFLRQRDVVVFIVAAGGGMLVSALGGVTALHVAGLLPLPTLLPAAMSWWMGDAVGVLLAAPLFLTCNRDSLRHLHSVRREVLLWLLLAGPVLWLAFIHDYVDVGRSLPLAFFTLPLLAWSALRFGNPWSLFAGLGFSVVAAWSAAEGHGTFALRDAQVSQFLVWAYMASTVLTGLLITALLAERRGLENDLRESEARNRRLASATFEGVAITESGHFIDANEQLLQMLGYRREELLRLTIMDLLPEAERQPVIANILAARESRFEHRMLRRDGSLVEVEVHSQDYSNGGPPRRITAVRDITAQKRSQQRLEQLLAEQKALLDNDLVCIVRVKNRRIVWATPAFEKMLGYGPGELAGTPTSRNYPDEEAYQAFGAAAYQVLTSGRIFRSQVEQVRKDGTRIWVDISGALLDAASGESLWGFVDISERKQAQVAQDQLNALRRALLDNSAVGIFLTSTERRILEVSQRMCEMFGYSPVEFVGQSTRLIHVDEESFLAFGEHYALFRTESRIAFEYPFRHCDGRVIWCSVIGTPLDADDLGKGVIWTFLDIEERRRLAEEAEKDRKLLKDIVDSIPAAVSYWDARDEHEIRNVFSNRSYADLYEMTPDQLVGMHVRDLLGEEIYLANWGKMQEARQGAHVVYNRYQPSVNGKPPRHAQVHYIPDIRRGEPQGLYVMMFDTTELKNSELALVAAKETAEQATRIKSQFLANMSHEIRTPMNAIIGLTGLVLESELTARQRDYLGKVSNSAKALLRLLNDVLDYSKLEARQFVLERLPFSLDEVIRHVEDIFAFRLEEKRLNWRVVRSAEIPPALLGDALRLSQILINLVGNAIKFTERGEIVLGIALLAENASSVQLRISVTDTGIGMSPEERSRIFAAFAQADSSVSRKYGGTGLGLTITRQLVELMGGELEVSSRPGVGSTFAFAATFDRVSPSDTCPASPAAGPEARLTEPRRAALPDTPPAPGPELHLLSAAEREKIGPLLAQLANTVADNNFAAREIAERIEEMLAGSALAPDFAAVIAALRKLRFKNAGESLRAFCQNHADTLGEK